MPRPLLPETRVELSLRLILLLLLLIAVDLLLAPLDATQVRLGRRGLVGLVMVLRLLIDGLTGCLMPHEARLRELVSVGYDIASYALRLVQAMLSHERNGTLRLLAHLDVPLAAAMHVAPTCRVSLRIAVFVPS